MRALFKNGWLLITADMIFSNFCAYSKNTWWHSWCLKWCLPNAKSSLFLTSSPSFFSNEVQSADFANISTPEKAQHRLSQSVKGDSVEIWISSSPSLVALIYRKARYFLYNLIFVALRQHLGRIWIGVQFAKILNSLNESGPHGF